MTEHPMTDPRTSADPASNPAAEPVHGRRTLVLAAAGLLVVRTAPAQTAARPAPDYRALVAKGTRLSILTDRITRCQAQRALGVLVPRAERALADSVSEARSILAVLRQTSGPAPIPGLLASAEQALTDLLKASDALRPDDRAALGRLAVTADQAGEAVDQLVAAYVQSMGQPTASVLQTTADLQRLTQHLAVHYLLAKAGVDPSTQLKEVDNARREFETRWQSLKQAPVRNARTEAAVPLIEGQWTFLRAALTQTGSDPAALQTTATTSERTLEVLTDLYNTYDSLLRTGG